MTDTLDTVERLAEAARAAVLARWGAIEAGGAGHLRGITIELETLNTHTVIETTSCLAWKQTTRRKGG